MQMSLENEEYNLNKDSLREQNQSPLPVRTFCFLDLAY